jgi:hypothetical protein
MEKTMKKLTLIPAFLLAAALAACGSDSGTTATDPGTTTDTAVTEDTALVEDAAMTDTATVEDTTTKTDTATVEDTTLVEDTTVTPETTVADCGTECPLAAGLECVGKVEWAAPTVQKYSYTYALLDVMTNAAIPSVVVKICAMADEACATPTAQGTTDADGKVTVDLPAGAQGLDGYVQFEKEGYPVTLGFYSFVDNAAIYGTNDLSRVYFLVTNQTIGLLTGMVGISQVAERGMAIFSGLNCTNETQAGLVVTAANADAQTKAVYLKNGMPDATLTSTTVTSTGAIANIPVGKTSIVTTDAASGKTVGKLDVLVRAGAVTGLIAGPTPL